MTIYKFTQVDRSDFTQVTHFNLFTIHPTGGKI